jgi:hypothetical protein
MAVFAVGGLAPVFSYAFGSIAGQPLWTVAATAASCLVGSAALHVVGRRMLRKLIP